MSGAAPVLVLSGGNALGAYHAGAWAALEAAGVVPGWVVGASVGAITGAIIAGNPPTARGAALQRFWSAASTFDFSAASLLPYGLPYGLPQGLLQGLRQPLQYAQALSSRVFGRAALFSLRPPDLSGSDTRPSLFDLRPMRQLLAELVDFARLNSGALRLTVLALDLASGAEVAFDTAREPLGMDHVIASASLIPDFPPVAIGGRLLVDGGLAANLPLHLVLQEPPPPERLTCFAVDLFPQAAALPVGVLQAAQRQSDLIFASQTARTLRWMQQAWQGRVPGADVFYLAYQGMAQETAIKGFDFSAGTILRRRQAGQADMARQIAAWRAAPSAGPGLQVHRLPDPENPS
jgi:NTE family protein